jgi:hypothetical protein
VLGLFLALTEEERLLVLVYLKKQKKAPVVLSSLFTHLMAGGIHKHVIMKMLIYVCGLI